MPLYSLCVNKLCLYFIIKYFFIKNTKLINVEVFMCIKIGFLFCLYIPSTLQKKWHKIPNCYVMYIHTKIIVIFQNKCLKNVHHVNNWSQRQAMMRWSWWKGRKGDPGFIQFLRGGGSKENVMVLLVKAVPQWLSYIFQDISGALWGQKWDHIWRGKEIISENRVASIYLVK